MAPIQVISLTVYVTFNGLVNDIKYDNRKAEKQWHCLEVSFVLNREGWLMRNRDPHRENAENISAICLPIVTMQHIKESSSASRVMGKSGWHTFNCTSNETKEQNFPSALHALKRQNNVMCMCDWTDLLVNVECWSILIIVNVKCPGNGQEWSSPKLYEAELLKGQNSTYF